MRIICVDDEQLVLNGLLRAVQQAESEAEVFGFRRVDEALAFARENVCDVAFLDIRMPGKSGLALAKELKEINAQVNIIFVTGYVEYMANAFAMHASGYIEKPVTKEKVSSELANLRHPLLPQEKLVRIQTFGNFEVYVANKPIKFTRSKSKELLAYLVDRQGCFVSYNQCRALLWENEQDSLSLKNRFRLCVYDLKATLDSFGVKDIIVKSGNNLCLDREKVNCDYFDWLDGLIYAVNAYHGEYMYQYSWAEFTLGEIDRSKKRR